MTTLNEVLDQIPIILKQRYNVQKFWIPMANKILGEIEPYMEFQETKVIENVRYYKDVVKYPVPDAIRKLTYVGAGANRPDENSDSAFNANNISDKPWCGSQSISTVQGFIPYTLHGDKIIFSSPIPTTPDFPEFTYVITGGVVDFNTGQVGLLPTGDIPDDNQLVGTWLRLVDFNGVVYDRIVTSNTYDGATYVIATLDEPIPAEPEFVTIGSAETIYDYFRVEGFAKITRFDTTIPDGETDPTGLSEDIPLKQEWERVLVNGLRFYGETQMQATSGEAQRWQQIYYGSIEDLKGDNWRNRGFQRLQQPSEWPTIG